MIKHALVLFFIFRLFIFSNIVLADDAPPRNPAGASITKEKLLLLKAQAGRDVKEAEELRSQAKIQINNAKAIMEKARANPDDDYIKAHQGALKMAPEMLDYGEEVLAKAEKALHQARLRVEWTDRALNNLDGSTKDDRGGLALAGGAFPLGVQGKTDIIKKGQGDSESDPNNLTGSKNANYFFPGEKFVTGDSSKASLGTTFSFGYNLIADSNTSVTLLEDNNRETSWQVHQGRVHFEPLGENYRYLITANTPLIYTPDKIVEGNADSEFDVTVDRNAQTQIKVYKGEVKVKEKPKTWLEDYTTRVIKEYLQKDSQPEWWEDKI